MKRRGSTPVSRTTSEAKRVLSPTVAWIGASQVIEDVSEGRSVMVFVRWCMIGRLRLQTWWSHLKQAQGCRVKFEYHLSCHVERFDAADG